MGEIADTWATRLESDSQPDPDPYFAGKSTFEPTLLGRAAEEAGNLRLGPGGSLWRYQDGVYRPDGEDWLAQFTRDQLGDQFRENRRREVKAWCHANTASRISTEPDTDLINVTNGILSWREDPPRLIPHSPKMPSLLQIPVIWDPTATCPSIRAFLDHAFPGAEGKIHQVFLAEWIGYLLIPWARFKKALMLIGGTDTGKSTLLSVIEDFLGPNAVSNVTLQSLTENRFAGADLFGKLANVSADLDAKALKHTGLFKQLTGGGTDTIRAEEKFGSPFTFRPYARLMFSANSAPGTPDQTDAYYHRWFLLPMTQRIQKVDATTIDRLTTPAELSGLLNLAVAGLKALMVRGKFEESDSMRVAVTDYKRRTDTVVGFVDARCALDPDARTKSSELFDDYVKWCESGKRYPLGRDNFIERILEVCSAVQYKTRYSGYPTYFGIRLASPTDLTT